MKEEWKKFLNWKIILKGKWNKNFERNLLQKIESNVEQKLKEDFHHIVKNCWNKVIQIFGKKKKGISIQKIEENCWKN